EEAFVKFYDNEVIGSRHCGVNTQKFLLFLEEEKVSFEKGYVVSVHDDFMHLNHFDARWGSQEEYANGIPYRRSNWYFHVFAILDGKAFDFSQQGPTVLPLNQYLRQSYLPSYPTNNVF